MKRGRPKKNRITSDVLQTHAEVMADLPPVIDPIKAEYDLLVSMRDNMVARNIKDIEQIANLIEETSKKL